MNNYILVDKNEDSNQIDINNNSNNSSIQTKTVLEQYNHQVGGHSTILSIDNKILKPLISREFQFYQYVSNYKIFHNFLISAFLAKFYGTIDILNNGDVNNSSSNSNSNTNVDNNVNNKKKLKISSKHPIGTKKQYIMLEDITVNYKKPCIVDIKIGTRQRGIVCSSTTSTSLGVRVCGMKLYKENFGYLVFDRYIGRSLNPDSLENLLFSFFSINTQNTNSKSISDQEKQHQLEIQINLLNSILEKLNGIKNILSNEQEPFPFKIYSSSLLIVYEGSNEDRNTNGNEHISNFNDSLSFVNSNFFSPSSSSSSLFSTSSESNSSILSNSSGISSCDYDEKSTTPEELDIHNPSSPNIHLNGADNVIDGKTSNSSGLDKLSEILNTLSLNINSSSNRSSGNSSSSSPRYSSEIDTDDQSIGRDVSSSSISSSEDNSSFNSRCSSPDLHHSTPQTSIKNDVKMIDFAHAIPNSDIQESGDDDGYVFGIQNLINILSSIKYKMKKQQSHPIHTVNLIQSKTINNNSIISQNSSLPIPIGNK